jgi:16S rRNA (guanine527-N7)-methyltransferase
MTQLLKNMAADYGIALSDRHSDLFQVYLEELIHWNRRMNLTGPLTKERMIVELFLDSLIPGPFIPATAKILDVGSGAGFPGVPLKIHAPHRNVDLLEINAKKVSFLKQVIRLLGLSDIAVVVGRVEKIQAELTKTGYQVVTARAVADLGQVIAWCAPLLSPDGLLVSFLGGRYEDDLKRSNPIIGEHRLVPHKVIPYELPGRKTQRHTVIFRKA